METVYELLNKYVELIKKDYCSDCNELNCIGNFPNKDIASAIQQLLQENKELKGRLKKIDKYCEQTKEKYKYYNECNTTDVRVISKIIKGDE